MEGIINPASANIELSTPLGDSVPKSISP